MAVVPTAIISRNEVFMPRAATEMTNNHFDSSVSAAAIGLATISKPLSAASATKAIRKPGSNGTLLPRDSFLSAPRAASSVTTSTTGSSMVTLISLTMVAESPACGEVA